VWQIVDERTNNGGHKVPTRVAEASGLSATKRTRYVKLGSLKDVEDWALIQDPENAKDTLCRNVLIYGHCRYEDQGCAFNHDPNKTLSAQQDS
jgi:hypothetical protein